MLLTLLLCLIVMIGVSWIGNQIEIPPAAQWVMILIIWGVIVITG